MGFFSVCVCVYNLPSTEISIPRLHCDVNHCFLKEKPVFKCIQYFSSKSGLVFIQGQAMVKIYFCLFVCM